MAKRWQKDDISYLQRYGKSKPVEELARRFNTDPKTVRAKLAELAPPSSRTPARKPAAKPAPRPAARPAKPAPKAARPAPKTAAKPKAAAKPAPKAGPAKPAAKAKPAPRVPPARPAPRSPARPSPKPAAAKPAAKPAAKTAPKPAPPAPPRTTAASRAAAPKTAATPAAKPAKAPAAKAPAPPPSAKPPTPDPGLTAFADALKAMHKQDWSRAVKLFEKVAADDDAPEIAARARQFLAAARQRLEAEESRQDHEDAYLQAVFEKNRGNLAAALELCRRGGREKKDERFAYLAASIHALEGRGEEAAQALSQAVELNPKNRIHAYHDADFAELRKDQGFRERFDFP